ncbi:ubiquitin specific peptidase 30-like protein [Euroglyphus maynei]|uniref:ubiquitinyl hydrolase 1 n=1 Tax=Euroglyphus maynei TaxID=6958 RepID=A0A1Y3AL05_EURMA|nr:ubiquitin specific peptidase 30-like protein [Euroglyphus maynei]
MFGTGMVIMIDTEILYIVGVSAIGAVSLAYVLFGFSSDSSKKRINNKIDCDSSEILTPEGVLDSLRKHRWMFSSGEQDAFELFSVLLTTIDFESNQLSLALSIRDSVQSNQSDQNILDELSNKNKFITRVRSPVESMNKILSNTKNSLPTRGILSNHLNCQNCHRNYPILLDVFNSISLSLPLLSTIEIGSSISLEMCLNKFLLEEEIKDFSCQYCNQKTTFTKRIELIKLPRLLCFHVHRLVWYEGNQTKRVDHIKFPEVLIMDPFKQSSIKTKCRQQQQQQIDSNEKQLIMHERISSSKYIYILNSVIVHLGNNHSGHFVCYRRSSKSSIINGGNNNNRPKNKWYYTSDLVVKEVSKKEVFASCAYMLFYEKATKKE